MLENCLNENVVLELLARVIKMLEKQAEQELSPHYYQLKELHKKHEIDGPRKIHARLVHLPPHTEFCKPSISSIEACDVGKIVQITGTVVRNSPVRMSEMSRAYRCTKKTCGHAFVMNADLEQLNNALPFPTTCPLSAEPQQEDEKGCDGTSFEVISNGSVHTDYQEIKIQESASSLEIGSIPRSILVKLTHDLVDSCQPGDEVFVVGSLIAQWSALSPNIEMECTIALRALSIKVVNDANDNMSWDKGGEDGNIREKYRKEFDEFWFSEASLSRPIASRNFICRAICPKLWGMLVVKLALLITLIGGTQASDLRIKSNNINQGNDAGEDSSSEEDDEPEQFNLDTIHARNNQEIGISRSGNKRKRPGSSSSAKSPTKAPSQNEAMQTRRRAQSHILLVGDPGMF